MLRSHVFIKLVSKVLIGEGVLEQLTGLEVAVYCYKKKTGGIGTSCFFFFLLLYRIRLENTEFIRTHQYDSQNGSHGKD